MTVRGPLTNVPVADLLGGVVVVRIESYQSNADALAELAALAIEGAQDPELAALAARLSSRGPDPRPAIQAWVQQAIAYVDEDEEQFETPRLTVALGSGDCDAHAVLVCALARAVGVSSMMVPMGGLSADDPSHVTTALGPRVRLGELGPVAVAPWQPFERPGGLPAGWAWTETTIAARFGEHPVRARDRLGIGRTDLR